MEQATAADHAGKTGRLDEGRRLRRRQAGASIYRRLCAPSPDSVGGQQDTKNVGRPFLSRNLLERRRRPEHRTGKGSAQIVRNTQVDAIGVAPDADGPGVHAISRRRASPRSSCPRSILQRRRLTHHLSPSGPRGAQFPPPPRRRPRPPPWLPSRRRPSRSRS